MAKTLCSQCRVLGSVPGQVTKIPQVAWHSQKVKKKKKKERKKEKTKILHVATKTNTAKC